MALADVISWTCIGSLYVGFASVQGLLIRSIQPHGSDRLRHAAALAFAPMVLLPATIMVLLMPGIPLLPRLGILALGAGAVLAARSRPPRLPGWLFSLSFGRLYLGFTMALAAFWALVLAARTAPSSLIGTASIIACLFAALSGSRQFQTPVSLK
jgi:hypothetical protein